MDHDSSSNKEIQSLPAAGISETLGLLEVIDDHGGEEKSYSLASELNIETDSLLTTIKAAEMFGFIDTPGRDVILTPIGKQMIETEMNTKKQLLLEQLRKIELFAKVKEALESQEEERLSRDDLLKMIQSWLPNEKAEDQFETLINWGRWDEFLGYSQDDDYVYLDQG